MIGIYLLVTLICQFSPHVALAQPGIQHGVVNDQILLAGITEAGAIDGSAAGTSPIDAGSVGGRAGVSAPEITASEALSVSAQFAKVEGIAIGSAVLAGGRKVGSVAKIEGRNRASDIVLVELRIHPEHRQLLREGTVALLASPQAEAKAVPETVVELLLPERSSARTLPHGAKISGFSSYKEFWSTEA